MRFTTKVCKTTRQCTSWYELNTLFIIIYVNGVRMDPAYLVLVSFNYCYIHTYH